MINDRYRQVVNYLESQYGTLDPLVLCDKLNFEIKYVDFLQYPLGETVKMLDMVIIYVNNSIRNTNMLRFVLAHELCHALDHTDIVGYYTFNSRNRSKVELEADRFAELLLTDYYEEDFGYKPKTKMDVGRAYGIPDYFEEIF